MGALRKAILTTLPSADYVYHNRALSQPVCGGIIHLDERRRHQRAGQQIAPA
jgi:hypothetical protein